MRIGIIDLGTNSVRFDIHAFHPGKPPVLLHREKLMIRLGQKLFLNQKLDPGATKRAIEAFKSFKHLSHHFRVQKIVAFGTSALREASDSESLIQGILKKTGIDIRVISGEEEAQLIALGVLTHEKNLEGKYALVDIGGGSTEISICRNRNVLFAHSFPLGTARLQQLFLSDYASLNTKTKGLKNITDLRHYIQSVILPRKISEKWPQPQYIIGSSGTIRVVEKILKKHHNQDGVARKDLRKLVEMMSKMNRAELLKVPGMEPKRVDMILAGAILIEECMDALGVEQIRTTHFSLRDGILDRELERLSSSSSLEGQFDLDEILQKSKSMGLPEKIQRSKMEAAQKLFRETQHIHRLKLSWEKYLLAALILQDTGKVINPNHYETHTAYIIQSADFLGMEKWESEFISELCLKYNTSKLSKKDLDFITSKSARDAFLKLLALHRIILALHEEQTQACIIDQVLISRTQLKIQLKGSSHSELRSIRVERRKELLELLFKKQLILE